MRSQKPVDMPREIAKTPFGDRKNTLQQNSLSTPMKKSLTIQKNNNFHLPQSTPLKTPLMKIQKQSKPAFIKPDSERISLSEPVLFTDADIDRILSGRAMQCRTPLPPPSTPAEIFEKFDFPVIDNVEDDFMLNFNQFIVNDKKVNGFKAQKRYEIDNDDDDDDELPPIFLDSNDEDFKCYF